MSNERARHRSRAMLLHGLLVTGMLFLMPFSGTSSSPPRDLQRQEVQKTAVRIAQIKTRLAVLDDLNQVTGDTDAIRSELVEMQKSVAEIGHTSRAGLGSTADKELLRLLETVRNDTDRLIPKLIELRGVWSGMNVAHLIKKRITKTNHVPSVTPIFLEKSEPIPIAISVPASFGYCETTVTIQRGRIHQFGGECEETKKQYGISPSWWPQIIPLSSEPPENLTPPSDCPSRFIFYGMTDFPEAGRRDIAMCLDPDLGWLTYIDHNGDHILDDEGFPVIGDVDTDKATFEFRTFIDLASNDANKSHTPDRAYRYWFWLSGEGPNWAAAQSMPKRRDQELVSGAMPSLQLRVNRHYYFLANLTFPKGSVFSYVNPYHLFPSAKGGGEFKNGIYLDLSGNGQIDGEAEFVEVGSLFSYQNKAYILRRLQ